MAMAERSIRGRIIAHAVFWTPAAYVVIAVILSILRSLYGDGPGCMKSAAELREQLESQVSLTLEDPNGGERWTRFEPVYRTRLNRLSDGCRESPEIYATLELAFVEYSGMMRQVFDVSKDLDRLLGPN